MPIRGKKQRFTDTNISKAPNSDGVYGIYRGQELTYIGKGEGKNGIKSRLQAAQRENRSKGNATSFRVEKCRNPSEREKWLLEQYKKLHGKLQRYKPKVG